jgi:GEVED domain/Secretion system C-terminal sorting domain/Fibronectin type III domain
MDMKKIKLLVFFISVSFFYCTAQVSSYNFTAVAGTYSAITGTPVGLLDDGSGYGANDEGVANGIPIGFSFTYSGATYTNCGVSSNGHLGFGTFTNSNLSNNLSTGGGGARPIIAPLWDDHDVQNVANVTYITTGAAPNRIFTVQWKNVKWTWQATAGCIDFQVKLFETTNIIEFHYSQLAGALVNATASIGISATATGSGNFLNLSDAGAAPATSSTISATTISAKPASGQVYRFAPPSCGAPNPVVTSFTATSGNFSWPVVTGATGYEYLLSGSSTPPASGTTTAGTTASASGLTADNQYYFHVRSNCSGTFSSWTTLPFFTGYCTPTYSNGCSGDNIASVTLSTLSDVGLTCSPIYEDRTPLQPGTLTIPDLAKSVPATLTLTFGTDVNQFNGVWIDFNQNLVFETSEYFTSGTNAGASGAAVVSITPPAGALLGNTRMRIRGGDDTQPTSTQACGTAASNFGSARDYLVNIIAAPSCVPPTALTITPTSGSTANFSWTAASGSPSGYEWSVITTVTPPASGTATASTNVSLSSLVTGTQYYAHVRTNCGGTFSPWATLAFGWIPNDTVCGAIALTLGGSTECGNTASATSVGDPALPGGCSSPNNTVWYKYTPATTGTVILKAEIPGATSNPLNGWIAWYTAAAACPTPGTLTPVAGSSCGQFGQTGVGDIDSLISPVLNAGTVYYIMIDGFSGDNGEYCVSLLAPPPPPLCTTNLAPGNGSVGVAIPSGQANISWNAAATATSYDVYFGTVNPPTVNVGNTTATNVNITGLAYSTTYYWYVAPKNSGGAATGCSGSTFSFTTAAAPSNCVPFTTTGCGSSDRIDLFRLKGESSELNINTGTTCPANAYTDTTDHAVVIDLARGKSYWGQVTAGTSGDYLTLWLDANDNGLFENTERLMNNLALNNANPTNISLFIPLSTTTGNHRLRARLVYYGGTAPTLPTDPCGTYTYSETEDYLVNIVAGGTPYTVSTYPSTGACYTGIGVFTADAASNNNANYIPIVDSTNSIVAQIYPDGNDLGTVTASYYKHNGPVRQDVTGRYYLDRNYTIAVTKQPTSPYRLRLLYQNAELNALIAQPGSGVTSQFDLVMTKTNGASCETQYVQQTPTLQFPIGFGSLSGDRFLDFVGLTSFSRFFLHGGSSVLLPVSISSIRGEITGASNTVYWTTASENNNQKFVVQRSTDGSNFTTLGDVVTRATNGTSSIALNYNFVDINPVQGKAYYRLQMVANDGRTSYSAIVTLRRGAGKLEIVDVRPNPAKDKVYFNVLGANGNITVSVKDLSGKEVMRKGLVPSNGFNIDLGALANGMYILEARDTKTNEKAVYKIVKE